jgi:hypothetical protein
MCCRSIVEGTVHLTESGRVSLEEMGIYILCASVRLFSVAWSGRIEP